MNSLLESPFMGLGLTLGSYVAALAVQRKVRSPLANPIVIAMAIVIATIKLTGLPLASYQKGGDLLVMMIVPATSMLGLAVYRQLADLKAYWLPVTLGCAVGAAVSIGIVLLGARLFNLGDVLKASLIPKSVTNAIAVELSDMLGGVPSLTILAVLVTGIFGVLVIPYMIKLFCPNDPVAQGLAIGASTHLIGTTKAIELGEVQGAMSSIAVFATGLATVAITLLL
jgi:putative effector of murein hydrolase